MKKYAYIFIIGLVLFAVCCSVKNEVASISISTSHPKYFEKNTGEAWIPIAVNYLPYATNALSDVDYLMGEYFRRFSENGGNSMRIWISTEFLEIEDEEEGKYNPMKFERIDKLLELAEKYEVYIKFTLHHIRTISPDNDVPQWSNSKALSTKFENIEEYIGTPGGINSYLNRARALARKYRDNKQIYAWELWNEMDALPNNLWIPFTKAVLDSVKNIFPKHLVTQTLGSLHSEWAEQSYKELFAMNNNDFVSIHRYLDLGNDWGQYASVKNEIDTLVYSAMRFANTNVSDRPVIMNEIGAVNPNHAGAFELYKSDSLGILIHDMIFAPFFCGSAGSGVMWHWDHYVYPNDLWYHFQRFKNAIEGINPVKEMFVDFAFESNGVRCFGLKGKTKTIIWGRDAGNSWKTELEQGIMPQPKTDLSIDIVQIINQEYTKAQIYDPWNDSRQTVKIEENRLAIPAFTRSVVIVLE